MECVLEGEVTYVFYDDSLDLELVLPGSTVLGGSSHEENGGHEEEAHPERHYQLATVAYFGGFSPVFSQFTSAFYQRSLDETG